MKKLFFSVIIAALFVSGACSSSDNESGNNENNTPPPAPVKVDSNDKLLAELYLRTFGYLFTGGEADTDVERVLELQNKLVEANEASTRGIIGGTAAVAKFVNIIRLNQKSTTAKIVSVLLRQNWTPEKVFANLRARDNSTKYGYSNAQEFYDALLSGKLNNYAGNIYNDLYNSGTEFCDETVHPMNMAVMLAPELAECAKDIIFAAYPTDMISWGSVSNDLVNDVTKLIEEKGDDPEQIVSLAKDILTAATMSVQLELENPIDQDKIDLIIGKSSDAVIEYIKSVEQPDEGLASAWDVVANWVYEEVPNDPNSEWHQFLHYTKWHYYEDSQYYTVFFSADGSVTVNVYAESGYEGWMGEYNGKYMVSGDHIAIKTSFNGNMLSGVATMAARVSGLRRHLILTKGDESITLQDVDDPNWEPVKSPIPPGTYERFSYNEKTDAYENVNELGMTLGKNNEFLFYSNIIYFNRFEGKYTYSNGTISVHVSSFYSIKEGRTISVSGTVSAPCQINGTIITIGSSEYQGVYDKNNVRHGLKIIAGTYRLQQK